MADAEAICEAVTRPNMRFVVIKSAEQQSIRALHRARALLVRQRSMLANAIGAHLTEFVIVVAQCVNKLLEAVTEKKEQSRQRVRCRKELQAQLAARGHRFSIGALWRFFDRHDIA